MNKSLARVLLFAALVFCGGFAAAQQGKLFGEKNLRVAKTKYFQLIYPPTCVESAALLYQNADRIYEEVAASFNGRAPYLKLFVVITSKPQAYQGIYDDLPFPRILICDTARRDETLSFADDILSNFRHEITHTYSRTVRDPMWKLFGFDFGFVWTTTGITEGETIVSESADGVTGRLNDEYFRHIVKQARIENKFPNFSDVQGPYDAYRQDAYKNFNAMFTDYIQKKHGMEKYYQWLFKMTNLRTFTVRQAFKKYYGIGLNQEWRNFRDSLNYDFVKTNLEDFEIREFTQANNSGKFFSHLQKCRTDSGEKCYYFLDLDSSCVYFASEQNPDQIKKVFYKEGVSSISASQDGKYIAVSYDTELGTNTQARLALYDTQNKNWIYFDQTGLFNSAIVQSDAGSYHIVSTTYERRLYKTQIARVDFSGKKPRLVPQSQIAFAQGQFPACYCAYKDGFAFILKDKNEFSICTSDFLAKETTRHSVSKDIFIKQLSNAGENLCFSYTQKDSMPRLGLFDKNASRFLLDQNDFSGGVFFPVAEGGEVLYIANFYRDSKIFSRKISFEGMEAAVSMPLDFATLSAASTSLSLTKEAETPSDVATLQENSKKLRVTDMYKKYMIIPFALTITKDYVPGYSTAYSLLWGVSLFGADPWEGTHLNLFAGYGFETNSVAIKAQYSGGAGTEIFKYNLKSTSEFDKHGWKLSNFNGTLTSIVPLENNSSLSFGAESLVHYGRRNERNYSFDSLSESVFNIFGEMKKYAHSLGLNSAKSDDLSFYLYTTNELLAKYSYIEKFGNGRYEQAGVALGADLYYILNERTPTGYEKTEREIYKEALDLGFDVTAYFPGFKRNAKNANKFTYTLPAKFIFSLFPMDIGKAANASLYVGSIGDALSKSDLVFTAFGELILFATEIQRAVPGIQIAYINEVKVSLTGYDILFNPSGAGTTPYFHHYKQFADYCSGAIDLDNWFLLGLRAELGISANFGVFCGNELAGRFFTEAIIGIAGTHKFHWSLGFELEY